MAGLGEQKCNRHPLHMAGGCPHHGMPQEEECRCRAEGPMKSGGVVRLESMIQLDGVDFVLSVGTGFQDAFAAQRAAVKLKEATEKIGARWS